jgi:DNA invertase Pin-like site-specific DNA recombinase
LRASANIAYRFLPLSFGRCKPAAAGRCRDYVTVLGGLAEFERDLIRTRTSEGRERAKARGVKLGRKPKLTDHQNREAIRRRDRDGEAVREIARSYNVSHSTIPRLAD